MGLKNLHSLEVTIDTPHGPLSVRGLSLDDVTRLVRRHRAITAALYDQMTTGGIALDDHTILGGVIMDQAPDLAAEIIALAAGDGDEASIIIAKRLPFPIQLEVLEAVGNQTFSTEAGTKKVVETVGKVLRAMSGVLTNLTASPTSSGVSDAK